MGLWTDHIFSLRGRAEERAPNIFSVHDAKLSLVTKETSTARPDIGCSHQGISFHSLPLWKGLGLRSWHPLFGKKLKEISQISSPCPHLRCGTWSMCRAQPQRWKGRWFSVTSIKRTSLGTAVLPSAVLIVTHHFIYTRIMAGNLQQHQDQHEFLKNFTNILCNSDPLLTDIPKFWHLTCPPFVICVL